MNKVSIHGYLLRGPPQLFADVRTASNATDMSMAAFIRDAVSRALVEDRERRAGDKVEIVLRVEEGEGL